MGYSPNGEAEMEPRAGYGLTWRDLELRVAKFVQMSKCLYLFSLRSKLADGDELRRLKISLVQRTSCDRYEIIGTEDQLR